MPFRSPQAVRLLNLVKASVLVVLAVCGGWLVWNAPEANTAVIASAPTPTAVVIISTATPSPTATATATAIFELPTLASTTAVSITTTTTTVTTTPTPPRATETAVPTTPLPTTPTTAATTAPSPTPTITPAPLTILYPQPAAELAGFELTMVGQAPPLATVLVFHNGVQMGTATADERGYWSHVQLRVEAGQSYTLTAQLAGEEAAVAPIVVTLNLPTIAPPCENPTPGLDLGERYLVGNCEWMTRIARTTGVDYFELLALNPQIGDPNLLRPGQVLRLPLRD